MGSPWKWLNRPRGGGDLTAEMSHVLLPGERPTPASFGA